MTQEQTKTEQFTPGHWSVSEAWREDGGPARFLIVSDARPHVALASIYWSTDEAAIEETNAHLIACAPELYTALKNLVARYDESEINAAIAALAKANGR